MCLFLLENKQYFLFTNLIKKTKREGEREIDRERNIDRYIQIDRQIYIGYMDRENEIEREKARKIELLSKVYKSL